MRPFPPRRGEISVVLNFTKMEGCGNDYIYVDCLAGLSFETDVQPADYSDYVAGYAREQLEQQLERRLAEGGVDAQVRIDPGTETVPAEVTLYTDRPEEALALAQEFLGESAYTFDAEPPQV